MFPPLGKLALLYLERKHPFICDCISAHTRYIDEYVNKRTVDDIQQLMRFYILSQGIQGQVVLLYSTKFLNQ